MLYLFYFIGSRGGGAGLAPLKIKFRGAETLDDRDTLIEQSPLYNNQTGVQCIIERPSGKRGHVPFGISYFKKSNSQFWTCE